MEQVTFERLADNPESHAHISEMFKTDAATVARILSDIREDAEYPALLNRSDTPTLDRVVSAYAKEHPSRYENPQNLPCGICGKRTGDHSPAQTDVCAMNAARS
jgi:hypothetical protein